MPPVRCRQRPVALAAFLSLQAWAATAQTGTAESAGTLSTVTVEASADASAEGLTKPFAGGQVARGGRTGILGNQDYMDSPFGVTSYTNELIQNQMARSVGDVLQNNPSVRVARGFGNFQESYFIRGFILTSDSVAYNGLYSLLPRQYISSELFERVELLQGASAFLTGAAPGGDGIGGSVNLLPKRAGNEPLTQLTLGASSGSQFYAATDIARRFGPDQSLGIRVNAARRDGGTGVDNEHVKLDVASVGFDWRSRNARLSADIGHQEHRLSETRTNVTLGTGVGVVPAAPDARTNWAQPWSYSNERDTFGTVRGEYDFGDNVTGWFAAGMRRGVEANSLANLTVSNALTGAGTTYRFDNTAIEKVKTGQLGVRARLATGPVKHELVAAYDSFESDRKNAYRFDFLNTQRTNLYNPIPSFLPVFSARSLGGNDLSSPQTTAKKRLTSYAIGDTMSFLDDSVLVTVGARRQTLNIDSFAYNTGAQTGDYDQSRTSPAAGVVFKATKELSVYANYIESLAAGETAPAQVAGRPVLNAGQALAPYVARQKELGLKYDGGGLGATAALFSIEKPRALLNAAGNFATEGKDRHQGLELTAFGEPVKGLRVLGGVTLLNAKQKDTGSAATDGRRVIGVPKAQGTLGLEWDVPGVRGLSLDARMITSGHSHADAANTLRVPGWTRFDVGARYITEVSGRLLTLRARIDNVANRDYWASVGGSPGAGYLVLGNPRTLSLTASVDF
ncbi:MULTISPECIES: TonB-dependent receptor [unclassified Variovorax]|uniref:TonB-dependent receptor n=1 Tax=unclassified Variovorax TaxID=663243 RepID=UPI00076D992F|nr:MULTISPECIES: TonB-dependent receptor [unclassified Variovorax]KWT76009.1 Ferrichrome-iron receptor [Variovorax sp. WDL1]PNG51572.1 Ferrichrome receptor FcuA [Variovorax sp. B2]PNG54402.1 Ferrichrome receptor FcuA [Variovorax sp. B4]VTV11904.1 Ferrichrome receptor FcuA precursor [Variovorax sp. WDL1]